MDANWMEHARSLFIYLKKKTRKTRRGKVLHQVILQWSKNSRVTLTFVNHRPQALMCKLNLPRGHLK